MPAKAEAAANRVEVIRNSRREDCGEMLSFMPPASPEPGVGVNGYLPVGPPGRICAVAPRGSNRGTIEEQ